MLSFIFLNFTLPFNKNLIFGLRTAFSLFELLLYAFRVLFDDINLMKPSIRVLYEHNWILGNWSQFVLHVSNANVLLGLLNFFFLVLIKFWVVHSVVLSLHINFLIDKFSFYIEVFNVLGALGWNVDIIFKEHKVVVKQLFSSRNSNFDGLFRFEISLCVSLGWNVRKTCTKS